MSHLASDHSGPTVVLGGFQSSGSDCSPDLLDARRGDVEDLAELGWRADIENHVGDGRHRCVALALPILVQQGHLAYQFTSADRGDHLATLAHLGLALENDHELIAACPLMHEHLPGWEVDPSEQLGDESQL